MTNEGVTRDGSGTHAGVIPPKVKEEVRKRNNTSTHPIHPTSTTSTRDAATVDGWIAPLPENLPEADLERTIIEAATRLGWRVCHIRPARTERGWRTPIEGHPGLPDLILARGGVVLLVELKTRTGQPTADQLAWLQEAGEHGRLWRPSDWPKALETLRGAA